MKVRGKRIVIFSFFFSFVILHHHYHHLFLSFCSFSSHMYSLTILFSLCYMWCYYACYYYIYFSLSLWLHWMCCYLFTGAALYLMCRFWQNVRFIHSYTLPHYHTLFLYLFLFLSLSLPLYHSHLLSCFCCSSIVSCLLFLCCNVLIYIYLLVYHPSSFLSSSSTIIKWKYVSISTKYTNRYERSTKIRTIF